MQIKSKLVKAILSGLLLGLPFTFENLYYLSFIAFLPFLTIFEGEAYPKRPFLLSYLTFLIFNASSLWWVGSWQETSDPFLIYSGIVLVFFHPVLFLIPVGIYLNVRRRWGANKAQWLFPFIWIMFEWLHSLSELSFPWLNIGYTQINNSLFVQTADLGGVYLPGFLILMFNVIILKLKLAKFNNPEEKLYANNKGLLVSLILIFVLPQIYGAFKYSALDHQDLLAKNNNLKIAVVQPNIDPWNKWEISPLKQITMMQRISDSIISKQKHDLVIWPETAISMVSNSFNSSHRFSWFKEWTEEKEINILSGFVDRKYYFKKSEAFSSSKEYTDSQGNVIYYDNFNSALMINHENDDVNIYHKMKLTPFSESVPYNEALSFIQDFVKWGVGISNWQKGRNHHNLALVINKDTTYIGSIICIESIYPDFCRSFAKDGAEILTVITNDGWFDYTPGPKQHFNISRMRAIENKRYLARSANTGISGFISPLGQVLSEAEQYTQTATSLSIPKLKNQSIYTIFGDWLPISAFILVIFSFLLSFFQKRKTF